MKSQHPFSLSFHLNDYLHICFVLLDDRSICINLSVNILLDWEPHKRLQDENIYKTTFIWKKGWHLSINKSWGLEEK